MRPKRRDVVPGYETVRETDMGPPTREEWLRLCGDAWDEADRSKTRMVTAAFDRGPKTADAKLTSASIGGGALFLVVARGHLNAALNIVIQGGAPESLLEPLTAARDFIADLADATCDVERAAAIEEN